MTLERIDETVVREEYGFSFPMRISGSAQTVRVVVSDDALVVRASVPHEEELQAQLEHDRPELESLATEKYNCGRVSAAGEILITANDALSFIE
ncbi:MAG: hypothetical protein ACR650_02090 [Methylocystis sp.]|jgi:hypothetical protein